MDNPHTLHHCASTLTLFMLRPQLPSDSTTPHNHITSTNTTTTRSLPPQLIQHPPPPDTTSHSVSIDLHPIIGNVVLPLLLPRRASPLQHAQVTLPQPPPSHTHAVHNPLPLHIHETRTIQPMYSVHLTNVRTSALHYRSRGLTLKALTKME